MYRDSLSLFILFTSLFYSMHKCNPRSYLPICHSRGWCSCHLKMHDMRIVSYILFGAKWGLFSSRDSILYGSENYSQEVGGKPAHTWFWWRGSTCNQAHIFFAEGFCWSWGAIITMKDFSAFLGMRKWKNWVHKISSWKNLSEDLFRQVFPEHRGSYFWFPLWTPFRVCRRSVVTG